MDAGLAGLEEGSIKTVDAVLALTVVEEEQEAVSETDSEEEEAELQQDEVCLTIFG